MTEYRYIGLLKSTRTLSLTMAVGKNERIAYLDVTDEEAFRLTRDLVIALGQRAGHRMSI